ncbi:hypothetical protein JCM8547_005631 [Rhodosporidiobolus lusitaniae]
MADHTGITAPDSAQHPTPVLAPSSAASTMTATSTPSTSSATIDGAATRPMYIPAVLQGPRNKHLQLGKKLRNHDDDSRKGGSASAAGGPGGKRRRRRWENAQLAHNPHLHRPSRADFSPGPNFKAAVPVFAPPPASFSRSTYSSPPPSSSSSSSSAQSAEKGQFSMSMRGLRKNLRSAMGSGGGGRTEEVLEIMERELVAWLSLSGRIPEGFYHDSASSAFGLGGRGGKVLDPTPLDDFPLSFSSPSLPDLPSSSTTSLSAPVPPPTLTELSRAPHALVWLAPSPHHRYLLHCLARYYHLPSFSRPLSPLDPPELRVTHVMRPQLVRPRAPAGAVGGLGLAGRGALETPPGTDWSSAAGGTTTEAEDTTTAGESSAYETDAEAESVVGWEDQAGEETFRAPEEEGGGIDWSADAEAEDEGSAEGHSTDSGVGGEGEESEYDSAVEGGEVDSLASSLASLPPPSASTTPACRRPSIPHSGSSTPRSAAPAPPPPFSPVPSSLSRSSPLTSSPLSTSPDTRLSRSTERIRGRRSLPPDGYTSLAESSLSRSRTREAPFVGERTVGGGLGEWRMPEKGFLEWVLGA